MPTTTITETQVQHELQRIDQRIVSLIGQDAAQRRRTITALGGNLGTLVRLGLIDDGQMRELCAKAQACDTHCLIQEESGQHDPYYP